MSNPPDIAPEEARWAAAAEQTRQQHSGKLMRLQLILFVSFAVFFGTIVATVNALLPTAAAVTLVVGSLTTAFGAGTIYYYQQKDVQAAVKQQLIAPLVRRINQSFEYLPKKGLKQADLHHSALFPNINNIHSGDLLRGRYGKTDFVCSHVEVFQMGPGVRKTPFRNGKFEGSKPSFSGLMIIADSNKHFKGRTIVVPDHFEKHFGRWFSKQVAKLSYTRLQNVEMEDPDFERAFEVHTTDQVEARYLLTPDTMERILRLQHQLDREIRIAFNQGRVYISIDDVQNIRVNLHRALQVEQVSGRVEEQWALIRTVIDGLGLNERLWSKA